VSITRTEILKIADLAKLHFSEEELDAFVPQFQRILDYIEQLKEANIEEIEPTSHVSLTADFENTSLEKTKSGILCRLTKAWPMPRTPVPVTSAFPKSYKLRKRI